MKAPAAASDERTHNHHRTIDRVVRILEEVVHRPGTTFGELARILEMPKSSLHGFVKGLLANGWLHEQQDGSQYRLFLGPGVYSLILTSGQIRAGMVSNADLHELQEKVRAEVYLGVLVGDQLVYVAEAGSDPVAGFHPRHIIRRELLQSAGGKALLASKAEGWLTDFLRRRQMRRAISSVNFFRKCATFATLASRRTILRTGLAMHLRQSCATAPENRSHRLPWWARLRISYPGRKR